MGTDLAGVEPLPNIQAILLNTLDTTGVQIGGTGPGEGNLIAFNSGSGSSTGAIWNLGLHVTIRGNSIHANAGLGIDNGNHGSTGERPGRRRRRRQRRPELPAPVFGRPSSPLRGAGTRVQRRAALLGVDDLHLDFYDNDGCTTPRASFLEGTTWLGKRTGHDRRLRHRRAFDVTLPVADRAGRSRISATATDRDGNTSEFSQRLALLHVSDEPATPRAARTITIQGTDFARRRRRSRSAARPRQRRRSTNSTTIDGPDVPAAPCRNGQRPDRDEPRRHRRNAGQGMGLQLSRRSERPPVPFLRHGPRAERDHGRRRRRLLRRQDSRPCASRWRCSS